MMSASSLIAIAVVLFFPAPGINIASVFDLSSFFVLSLACTALVLNVSNHVLCIFRRVDHMNQVKYFLHEVKYLSLPCSPLFMFVRVCVAGTSKYSSQTNILYFTWYMTNVFYVL